MSIRYPLGLALAVFAWSAAWSGPAVAEDLAKGEQVFKLCGQCHGPEGHGDEAIGAPAIAGMEAWYVEAQVNKFRDNARGQDPEDLPGLRMGPMAKTLKHDEQVTAVAAYVASLPPADVQDSLQGGDAAKGKTLYAPCTACHGPAGAGNQALFAPSLQHMDGWYMVKQLQNFKTGIRGTNPKDTSGALMRPMALILPSEEAMKDVVAYILTLNPKTTAEAK